MHTEHYFSLTELQFEAKEDAPGTISGYFHKWNTLSHDRGGYRVVFRRGAFENLGNQEADIQAYRDHNRDIYLGRTANATLRLSEDEIGGRFDLDLPDTSDGRDTHALIKRKDLVGMSFGYIPDKYQWMKTEEDTIQEHFSGTLVEVSVVFRPAFVNTNVQLNSMSALGEPSPETLKSLQDFLGTPRRNFADRELQLAKFSVR